MIFAAIDIGSNAVRLQVTRVLKYKDTSTFKKLEYVRFPLRLGHDVFTEGKISDYNCDRFKKLMVAYKNLIDLYEVDGYFGCATSAMREADNGRQLIQDVKDEIGLDIEVISGSKEAEMISNVIKQSVSESQFIHIDVGGGSTELNVYKDGVKSASKSFEIGSVRLLEGSVNGKKWEEMRNWISDKTIKKEKDMLAIGTGGNINKLYELSNIKNKNKKISLKKLLTTQADLMQLTNEERINKLQLNPDRADVIIPASKIYIEVMKTAKTSSIIVPEVGLKDGINLYLYKKLTGKSDAVIMRN